MEASAIANQQQQASTNVGFAVAQQGQRLVSLEDLLRRNEGTITHMLSRMKDVEMALNAIHRVTSKYQPEIGMVMEEMGLMKRKIDTVDSTWRLKAQDLDTVLQQEIQHHRPAPLAHDPLFQRSTAEIQGLKQEIGELHGVTQRLGELIAANEKTIRQHDQENKWLLEQFRDQVSQHREFAQQQQRKNDELMRLLQERAFETERGLAQIRSVVENSIKTLRDEIAMRLDGEAKARGTLQSDVVSAFSRMRDDVIKGFSQTAANLRNLDETAHSLETVLRAEVRSRMSSLDEMAQRMDTVELRVKREASSAAEYLKALDTQMSGALRDVREAAITECKGQLERVWRSIGELKDICEDSRHSGTQSQHSEVSARRQQLQFETEITKLREEVLVHVENRLQTVVLSSDQMAAKADLEELKETFDFEITELRNQVHRASAQAASNNAAKFETSLAAMESKIDKSERSVKDVAHSLLKSQRDLGEKVDRMESQAIAIDSLQKALQEGWQRDQTEMQEIVNAIRQQVLLLAQDAMDNAPIDAQDEQAQEKQQTKDSLKMLTDEIARLRESHSALEREVKTDLVEFRQTTRDSKLDAEHISNRCKDDVEKAISDMQFDVRAQLRSVAENVSSNPQAEAQPSNVAVDDAISQLRKEIRKVDSQHSSDILELKKQVHQNADLCKRLEKELGANHQRRSSRSQSDAAQGTVNDSQSQFTVEPGNEGDDFDEPPEPEPPAPNQNNSSAGGVDNNNEGNDVFDGNEGIEGNEDEEEYNPEE